MRIPASAAPPRNRLLQLFVILLGMALAATAQGACSSWRTPQQKVWFNEYFFGSGANAPPNFLELYSTSNTYAAQWQGSSVEVYSAANTKITYAFNNSTATACTVSNKTWVTYNVLGGLRQQNALVILRDALGDTIDAFVFDNASPPTPWKSATDNWAPGNTTGCAALDTALTTQAGLAASTPKQANMLVLNNYGNKDFSRYPDGAAFWDDTSYTGAGTTYTQCVSNNANFTKTVDNTTPTPGSTVTFTLSVANTGGTALSGVSLDDYLPNYPVAGAPTFVSATPVNAADVVTATASYAATDPNTGVSGNATKITWQPAPIAAGTTAKLHVKMQVPVDATPGYVYTNTGQTSAGLTTNQTDFANITIGSANVGSFVFSVSQATASTCAPALLGPKVTITTMTGPNGSGSVNTAYAGIASVTLTSSSPNAKWYDANGNLLTSLSPVPAGSFVNGVATFYLTDATAETITVSALDVSTYSPEVMQGSSGNITFTSGQNGLVLTDADTLSPGYGIVAGRPHKIRATLTSCGSTATSRSGNYGGSIRYTAGLNQPAGAAAPTLATSAGCPGTIGPLSTSGLPLALSFAAGVTEFYLCASDVGQYALNLTLALTSPTSSVSGSSGNFTVRPFAITATGLPEQKLVAGTPYPASFKAWNWNAAFDADGNGVPDAGVTADALAAAGLTQPPRFSGSINDAGRVDFSAAFGAGGAGTLQAFSASSATASAATASLTDLRYPDVGYIRIAGAAGYSDYGALNYLGLSGLHVPLLGISRWFVPAYFETSATAACNGFTYSAQPFQSVSIAAKNAAGITAQNYKSPGAARDVTVTAAGASGTIVANGSVAAASFNSGVATLTPPDAPVFAFSATPSAPTSLLTLHAVDSDGVSSSGHEGTTGAIRSGRLHLANAYGSERLSLPMFGQVEYFSGAGWVVNADDSCTTFADLGGPASVLALTPAGSTSARCSVSAPPCATSSGAACNAATPVSAGLLGLCLTAPNSAGYADVVFSLPPHLQFPHMANNAAARATFGIYKGNNRIIYRRERY